MEQKKDLIPVGAGEQKVVIVQEEVSFTKNVLRGFAFTLGTVLAITMLTVFFGRRW